MQKNRIELAGYLGGRPSVRYLPSGTPVANVRIAEGYRYTDRNNQTQEHTNWHSLVFYGDLADIVALYEKGDNIFVEGTLQTRQFTPKDGNDMLVACLWSHWTDPTGEHPDLLSFAAVTDDPEPEVAAAGHDRTIINIKPEHVDAWLNPDPANLGALYAIFDDKQHPYYEHQLEKAA